MFKLDYRKDLFYLKGKEEQKRITFHKLISHGMNPELVKELLEIDGETYKELQVEAFIRKTVFNFLSNGVEPDLVKKCLEISDEIYSEVEGEYRKRLESE